MDSCICRRSAHDDRGRIVLSERDAGILQTVSKMNSSLLLEKLLQLWRFKKALAYTAGDVLDFGGNGGELIKHLICYKTYQCVNDIRDANGKYDTIVMLAVIEHIAVADIEGIMKQLIERLNPGGKIVITTPSRILRRPLELLAKAGLLDNKNISEHKYYWSKLDFLRTGRAFKLFVEYRRFQFGLNQLVIYKKDQQ